MPLIIDGVFTIEGIHIFPPDAIVLRIISYDLGQQDLFAECPLIFFGVGHAVDLKSKRGEVSDHEIKDLIDYILVEFFDFGLLENKLAIHHYGKHLAHRQGEHGVHILRLVRIGLGQQLLEQLDLPAESRYIRQIIIFLEGAFVVMELNLSQVLGRSLIEQEKIVLG